MIKVAVLALLPTALVAQGRPATASLDSARARLAQLDGTTSLPELDSVVEVRRDCWGVPHIYARTRHDLFFAQGFVAAQDRLWQMEMWRRIGEGRLAEVIGPSAVARDRFARLLKYRGDMDREWTSYAPDAREIVHAFVDGVNAYIARVRSRPPIEFVLLGTAPEPWSYDVPLQRMAALTMTGNALDEVERAGLVKRLGVDRTQELWPTDPVRKLDPVPGLELGDIALGAAAEAYGDVSYRRIEGSNDWVVSGARTASGKPLLANDPHRLLSTPSLRYLTHLVGPGWNVIGAGEPALPGVAAGHNDRIGFGFTIVGMDQQDVYVERLRPCSSKSAGRCYWAHGSWQPIRTISDTIRVRGAAARVIRLEFTEHGPIVAEDSARRRAFVIRFVGSEPGTAGYLAQLSVDRAADWSGFLAATARWKLPTENLVYADVDGNIGWIAAGLMPVRSWSGLLPVPGDGRYEWQGFLRTEELPQSYNPASGMIVTANNNILPPGYRHPLSYEWAPPYRARRITDLLRRSSGLTVADLERLQHDEYSIPASQLVPRLLDAARRLGTPHGADLDALRSWDYVMSRDQQAPLLYEVWLNGLERRVRLARAGPQVGEVPLPLRRLIQLTATTSDSLVLAAWEDAVTDLEHRLGTDRSRWIWGALHRASFQHPVAAAFDLPAAPRGGDGYTVNATGGPAYVQKYGASYREILDFADWDHSVATSTPGQSGQPGSPYYGDLLRLWAEGEYFPLVYSRAAVERETAHVLTLTPTPGPDARPRDAGHD